VALVPPSSTPTGGSQPGVAVYRKFPITFDMPDLAAGVVLWTPAVDDILVDAWFQIDTAWDGTTPSGDIGDFGDDGSNGLFWNASNAPGDDAVDMTLADGGGVTGSDGNSLNGLSGRMAVDNVFNTLLVPAIASVPSSQELLSWPNAGGGNRFVPLRFTTTNPMKVVVSQDGTAGGDDPGSTQGAGAVYLVTVTPATS
jgi:hypothetical protein